MVTVGIVGAGLMGAGIGLISLKKGFSVILIDNSSRALERAQAYMEAHTKSSMPVTFSTQIGAAAQADIVIEAVFEDLAIKHAVIAALEQQISSECIIASNTSAIPISHIARGSKRPQNIVGMHYFSPVHKMPLLEIVNGPKTSPATLEKAIAIGEQQGKKVIVVQDGPGFYTTRILAPLLDEAILLAQEGIPLEHIDAYAEQYGFPVGPITLMDEVGIDVVAHASTQLHAAFGERLRTAHLVLLQTLVTNEWLGKKTAKGFYRYRDGFAAKLFGKKAPYAKTLQLFKQYPHASPLQYLTKQDITDRLVMRMLNEAVYCLEDGVLRTATDGNIGAMLGLGFPAAKGGPFAVINAKGPSLIAQTLQRLTDTFGDRFQPSELLLSMAHSNSYFT